MALFCENTLSILLVSSVIKLFTASELRPSFDEKLYDLGQLFNAKNCSLIIKSYVCIFSYLCILYMYFTYVGIFSSTRIFAM